MNPREAPCAKRYLKTHKMIWYFPFSSLLSQSSAQFCLQSAKLRLECMRGLARWSAWFEFHASQNLSVINPRLPIPKCQWVEFLPCHGFDSSTISPSECSKREGPPCQLTISRFFFLSSFVVSAKIYHKVTMYLQWKTKETI